MRLRLTTFILGTLFLSTSLPAAAPRHKKSTSTPIPTLEGRPRGPEKSPEAQPTSPATLNASVPVVSAAPVSPESTVSSSIVCPNALSAKAFSSVRHLSLPQSAKNGGLFYLTGDTPQLNYQEAQAQPPHTITKFSEGVMTYSVSPDGEKIALLTGNKDTDTDLYLAVNNQVKPIKVSPHVLATPAVWDPTSQWLAFTLNGRTPTDLDLYKINVDGTAETLITQLSGFNRVVDVSPDRNRFAILHFDNYSSSELKVWDDKTKLLVTFPKLASGLISDAHFTADSENIVLLAQFRDAPSSTLYQLSVGQKIIKPILQSAGEIELFTLDSRRQAISFTTILDGYSSLQYGRLSSDGKNYTMTFTTERSVVATEPSFSSLTKAADLLYVQSSPTQPTEIWQIKNGKPERAIAQPFPHPECLSREEIVNYLTTDHLKITGFLFAPATSQAPYLIFLPEEPGGQFLPFFQPWIAHLIGRGIGVLALNVRGSAGHGYTFRSLERNGLANDITGAIQYLGGLSRARPGVISVMGDGLSGLTAMNLGAAVIALGGTVNAFGPVSLASWILRLPKPLRPLFESELGPASKDKFRGSPTRSLVLQALNETAYDLSGFGSVELRRLSTLSNHSPTQNERLSWMAYVAHFVEGH
ncbi:MAG: hypothetical protein HYR96_05325 [Deltaproteobacteria bacterium]|nr:hypothetical protein [Deltaproteobacteria bacterium]MBI3294228.1 hypothetical protein [Deltaproteobacteria bacterium]